MLTLSVTTFGAKDVIVLKSAKAPTSWLFPLRSVGSTPRLDEASGSVQFIGRRGNVAAVIPPGFMTDASFDERIGAPARSDGVTYTLIPQGSGGRCGWIWTRSGWSIRLGVWPVNVDPSLGPIQLDVDDTFVSSRDYANRNNSSDNELLIGTYDGGGEKSTTFLHFGTALAALGGNQVTSASLNMMNSWSSCAPAPAYIYATWVPWWGPTTTTWPGPASSGTILAPPPVAAFGNCSLEDWVTFPVDAAQVMAWPRGCRRFMA